MSGLSTRRRLAGQVESPPTRGGSAPGCTVQPARLPADDLFVPVRQHHPAETLVVPAVGWAAESARRTRASRALHAAEGSLWRS